MSQFFFEIGVEEVPSSYILPATSAMEIAFRKALGSMDIKPGKIQTFSTPRRLAIAIDGLPDKRPSGTVKNFGPPKKAAFTPDGKPTKAAIGFAKKQGVDVSQLSVETTKKGEYLCAEVTEGGEALVDILAEITPKIVLGLPFPKSMTWGDGDQKFTRPIHWIVAIFDEKIVPMEITGIKSGNETRGHRFLAKESFAVSDATEYETKLQERKVIANFQKRKEAVGDKAESKASENSVDLLQDHELQSTIANLTEWPVALYGTFDEEFLQLPAELITAVLKDHQRMFAVHKGNKDELAAGFIGVSNMETKDDSVVVAGYERVVRARLKDAMFFLEEDHKTSLDDFAKKLDGVVYQKKLGTVGEKVERIVGLASYMTEKVEPILAEKVDRAARLCKADLETQMVYEFPELQGIWGRELAKHAGERDDVCNAIEQHYWPIEGPKLEELEPVGSIVGIADRIDTIAGCFCVGLIPTGNKDPFALRRHTLAIIHILHDRGQENGWSISIGDLVMYALAQLGDKKDIPSDEAQEKIIDFFKGRLKHYYEAQGVSYDVTDAVLSAGIDDLNDTDRRVNALNALKKKSAYDALVTTFKRVANITKDHKPGDISPALFEKDIEKTLFAKLEKVAGATAPMLKNRDYEKALDKIATLRPVVDQFFDDVLVMAEDEKVRQNRLNLLAAVSALFKDIADFSKLVATHKK